MDLDQEIQIPYFRYPGFAGRMLKTIVIGTWITAPFMWLALASSNVTSRCGHISKVKNDLRMIYNASLAVEAQTGAWPPSIASLLHPRDPTGQPIPVTGVAQAGMSSARCWLRSSPQAAHALRTLR